MGEQVDEVLCYSYSLGKIKTSSTFFYSPVGTSQVKDDELPGNQ